MGACGSKTKEEIDAEKRDAEIAKRNRADMEREKQKIKLLLLGAGESGKSTIFKQMKILYGVNYSEEERKSYAPVIYNNIILSMKYLIQACEDQGYEIQAKDLAEEFMGLRDEIEIDPTIGANIATLWADAGVQEAFDNRHKFQLNDSAPYYFKKIAKIAAEDYIPDISDVLKARVRTSGIVEEEYVIEETKFVMFDVGGQRNERKKWIHCFDDVTAVIFVAAISEYDQVLYEDATQNRLVEALNLFEEICNSKWFENTSMILFLNKDDLFKEKITHKDIRQQNPFYDADDPESQEFWFQDYTGGCNYDEAVKYIVKQFKEKNQNEKKSIFVRVTCATDSGNVKTVFESCREIILKQNLQGSGFMDT